MLPALALDAPVVYALVYVLGGVAPMAAVPSTDMAPLEATTRNTYPPDSASAPAAVVDTTCPVPTRPACIQNVPELVPNQLRRGRGQGGVGDGAGEEERRVGEQRIVATHRETRHRTPLAPRQHRHPTTH